MGVCVVSGGLLSLWIPSPGGREFITALPSTDPALRKAAGNLMVKIKAIIFPCSLFDWWF